MISMGKPADAENNQTNSTENNITLEQIDLVMERANVTYQEAKEALQIAKGDVVEALLFLEKSQKVKSSTNASHSHSKKGEKRNHDRGEGAEKVKNFIEQLNASNFILKKNDRTYVDIPLSVAIIVGVLSFYVTAFAIVGALIWGARVQITTPEESIPNVDFGSDDLKSKINK